VATKRGPATTRSLATRPTRATIFTHPEDPTAIDSHYVVRMTDERQVDFIDFVETNEWETMRKAWDCKAGT
jgi:hypothetical protein